MRKKEVHFPQYCFWCLWWEITVRCTLCTSTHLLDLLTYGNMAISQWWFSQLLEESSLSFPLNLSVYRLNKKDALKSQMIIVYLNKADFRQLYLLLQRWVLLYLQSSCFALPMHRLRSFAFRGCGCLPVGPMDVTSSADFSPSAALLCTGGTQPHCLLTGRNRLHVLSIPSADAFLAPPNPFPNHSLLSRQDL